MLQREIARLVFLIDEGGVTLRECAFGRILAREADRNILGKQGAEGETLRRCPVKAFAALEHLGPRFELTRDRPVNIEAFGHLGQRAADLMDEFEWYRGV